MTVRVYIQGLRLRNCVYRDLELPAVPRIGDWVQVHRGALGMRVHAVFVAPEGVAVRVMEEQEGDFNFAGLKAEGWAEA